MKTVFQWQYPDVIPLEQIQWIRTIFADNYDIHTEIQACPDKAHTLSLPGHSGNIVFSHHENPIISDIDWWTPADIELEVALVSRSLPVLCGNRLENGQYEFWRSAHSLELGIDFFATLFLMLSGQHDKTAGTTDTFQRSLAHTSLSKRLGFLDRPIVDEYIEVLWAYLRKIWPNAKRKRRVGTIHYSCDVDVPFDPSARSWKEFMLRSAADLVKRRSPLQMIRRWRNCSKVLRGDLSTDPNYQFDFIFEQIEGLDQPAVFYFLSTARLAKGSGWYKLSDPIIKDLIKRIADSGHHIGLHGSFGSFRNAPQIQAERDRLQAACQSLNIKNQICRNRQHYLQFDIAVTPSILESSGITHDSSGAYPDYAGFRFGTSIPFPMWSWVHARALKLIQEPLICMEASLLATKYMNLAHFPEAFEYAETLKQRALAYGGDFTLLWHNSHLKSIDDKSMLTQLLKTSH